MVFTMSDEAKRYYNKLNESMHGKFRWQFDFYYLCLLAGFQKEITTPSKGDEFIDQFPAGYALQKEQIIGLLIATEINRLKIDPNNRDRLEKLMLTLVKPDSPSRLSGEGETRMNQYAQTGFELISNEMPNPPVDLDKFLVRYYNRVLRKNVDEEEVESSTDAILDTSSGDKKTSP